MYDKNFDVSRENMVNNQIITNKVNNPLLIDALLYIEKEKFIPKPYLAITYSDCEIPFNPERSLMKTFIFAKILQYSDIKENDSVLTIGCLTGYSVAIISKLAGYVFGLEDNKDYVKQANKLLGEIACHNSSVNYGNLENGLKKNRPFDKILIEGAVENIPEEIISQLKEGGKVFSVFKKKESLVGSFKVGLKNNGLISYRHLFDANAKTLKAFVLKENGYDFKS